MREEHPSIRAARESHQRGDPASALLALDDPEISDSVSAINIRGLAYRSLGQVDHAATCFRNLTGREEAHVRALGWWGLVDLKEAVFEPGDAQQLDAAIAEARLQGASPPLGLLNVSRAELYHREGQFSRAFQHLRNGNALIAQSRPFQNQPYYDAIVRMCESTSPSEWRQDQIFSPVFVVGMPRSGTTLLSQALARHTTTRAVEENPFFVLQSVELQHQGGYIEALRQSEATRWSRIAERYHASITQGPSPESGLTPVDKTPENFLHLGFILRTFPEAKIVHVVRDPLDNIVSQYRQYFYYGREYSFSLDALIFYWRGYLTLMRHWLALFGDRIINVHYDQLVKDPTATLKQVLQFCDLTEEPQCFRPHEGASVITTPSAQQVRQPITPDRVGAGRHYAEQMAQWLSDIDKLRDIVKLSF
jgi:hypothetical protein